MPEDYALMLEEMKRMMANASGTNLAGQQIPDGSYGFYTPDFSYGSYKMPYEDPTYRSGFEYARTIAGGMPFEDVVAPGMSFSPEEPMGYTQADLRKKDKVEILFSYNSVKNFDSNEFVKVLTSLINGIFVLNELKKP